MSEELQEVIFGRDGVLTLRVNRGKFGRPGLVGGSSSEESLHQPGAEKILDLLRTKNGFSFRAIGATSAKTGYMSSVHDGPKIDPALDDEAALVLIDAHLIANKEFLSQDNNYVGGWFDKGYFYLDASRNYQDKNEAIIAGSLNHQIAIFDLNNLEDIRIHAYLVAHPDFSAPPGIREWYLNNPDSW